MDDMTETTPPPPPKREEKEEDALSLSEFALQNSSDKRTSQDKRRSSSEPSDFFEFFTADNNINMSHAEDIFFRGKLVPFTNRNHHHHPFLKSLSADHATRCELLPRPHRSRRYPSNDDKTLLRRRRRQWTRSDAGGNIPRDFSKRSAVSEGSPPPPSKASKPKWFVLMFGPLKLLQPEMDLREMKSRRGRRSPVSMFPRADSSGGDIPVGRRGLWGFDLLRVLSCKSHATVAVTAPSGLAPRC